MSQRVKRLQSILQALQSFNISQRYVITVDKTQFYPMVIQKIKERKKLDECIQLR